MHNKKRPFIIIAFLAFLISGCATKPLPQEELSTYQSIAELIADNDGLMAPWIPLEPVFMGQPVIKTGPGYHPYSEVKAPIDTLRTYCQMVSQGDFKKLFTNTLYANAHGSFNAYGGLYSCNVEKVPLWYAEFVTKDVGKRSLSLVVREVDQKSAQTQLKRHGVKVKRQKQAETAWRNSPRVKRFMAEAGMSKYPGLTVCSRDNVIARVQSVRADEIFVQVIGVARSPVMRSEMPDFQFFSGESFEYYFMETEATMWAKSKDWGACHI
ncbi:hypothetical protein [Marinobacter sp.]|uniref:hypothetical protein n=1 Tax=Marinobacter sp. TaxID=50741 RepID=UPI003563CFD3